MASLHKSASKLNAKKRKSGEEDVEDDEDMPVVSVKSAVKRRKDKVSSALLSPSLRLWPLDGLVRPSSDSSS